MSEITRRSYAPTFRNSLYGGIIIDIAEEGIDHAVRVLSDVNGGWQKAIGSALARAANAGKTIAKRAVTSEYTISQGTFLKETKNINHFVRERGQTDGVAVVFGYAGYVIPLMKFNTAVGKDGLVHTQVKRFGVRETLEHAFKAQMGHHTGIYERVGLDRFPVNELYGPATPQMMYSNEKVTDTIEEKAVETYEKRIDHEILRVMNGW